LSRIGKVPVKIPNGIQVSVKGQKIDVKGAKGSLSREIPEGIKAEVKDGEIEITPAGENIEGVKALWGLYRQLIQNMVIGCSVGYKKELEIIGVGYKAEMKGKDINVLAGYSGPKFYKAPEGIAITVENQTKIVIQGIDKETVGQVAADIRRIRPPEPYKGKGIRYLGEKVVRKAGKTAGK
jgi:large subunit ribosomal protein L6